MSIGKLTLYRSTGEGFTITTDTGEKIKVLITATSKARSKVMVIADTKHRIQRFGHVSEQPA